MSDLQSNLQLGVQIGSGHFGAVYEGYDEIHGKVAIKIPQKRPEETDAQWVKRRDALLLEGQNLKKAQHQNVVTVFHLVKNRGTEDLLLTMEFCEGGALQKAYDAGPIPNGRVVEIAADVAIGLSALHDRGLLHRDIKPGNILLDGQGRAKLGDFGLVTDEIILGYAAGAGYRDHLAFEVHTSKHTSVRTDIWALGMTFYRLLHGAPFYMASPAPRHLVPNGRFAQKLRWMPHVSDRWRRLIRAMMNDQSQDRPTIQKIINQLGELRAEPSWNIKSGADRTEWERTLGGRKIVVTREKVGGLYRWAAISEPLMDGQGKKHTLKKGGPAPIEAIDKQMQGYFAAVK